MREVYLDPDLYDDPDVFDYAQDEPAGDYPDTEEQDD